MSHIDEELKRALREAEAQPTADVAPTTLTPAQAPRRNIGLLISVAVMGGLILWLAMTNFNDAAIYSMGVDQLRTDQAKLSGRNVRVEGDLVSGTLVRRNNPCEYRFKMKKAETEVEVHYAQCVVPDTFRDVKGVPVQVTAEGRIGSDGIFQASQIFAKCPSKYQMQKAVDNGGVRPEHAPADVETIIPAKTIDN